MPPSTLAKARNIAIERAADIGSPLLLESFSYTEALSTPYRLAVRVTTEKSKDVDADKLLGTPLTLRIKRDAKATRYFDGVVVRVVQNQRLRERPQFDLTVVPKFWLLTRTSDCRVYQSKTVVEIIEEVFARAGIKNTLDTAHLKGKYDPHDFLVQYRETAFNFVSRLMEFEGIYYYFTHSKSGHKIVLADKPASHKPVSDLSAAPSIPFHPPTDQVKGERITDWRAEAELTTEQVSLQAFDFKAPATKPSATEPLDHKARLPGSEIFDYPVEFHIPAQAKRYAKLRAEELAAAALIQEGETNARTITVGGKFKLTDPNGYLRKSQVREHTVTAVSITGRVNDYRSNGKSADDEFTCSFRCIPSNRVFRPARVTPKPVVAGSQTATVVGPSGSEVHTDALGRVRVQFHWDRHGKNDENSSCWVRVSQPWAGKGYGGVNIPRIGVEVIVDFLEGDPDRPIIVGRVYNKATMPYGSQAGKVEYDRSDSKRALVKAQAVSAHNAALALGGMAGPAAIAAAAAVFPLIAAVLAKLGKAADKTAVSNSDEVGAAHMMTSFKSESLGGSGGSNEITMNDSGGNESLFLKAQKTYVLFVGENAYETVTQNLTIDIGKDRTTTIGEDDTLTIDQDSITKVGRHYTLNIDSDSAVTINGHATQTVNGKHKTNTINTKFFETVKDDVKIHYLAKHDLTIDDTSTTIVKKAVKVESSEETILHLAKKNITTESVEESVLVKAKKAITLEATDEQIEFKCGQSSMVLKKDGTIEIKGKDVKISGTNNIEIKATAKLDNAGATISSAASTMHEIKGTPVKINC